MEIGDPKKERELVLIQILYLYLIPIILFYFKIISSDFRVLVLLIIVLLLFGIIHYANWTYADLGIKKDFMKDIVPYSIFTIGSVLFVLWLAKVVPHEPYIEWWESYKFLLLFIPISVLQEILFRGILMNFLGRAFSSPIVIICINAGIFAFMHVIYLNSMFVLPLTFIAGIGFAWMYLKYKNLILISVSHAILNFVAVALGFFVVR